MSKEHRESTKRAPTTPVLATRRRRQLHPFFFRIGPVTLCIISLLLIGLMAVLYLSQQGRAVAANQQIQNLRLAQKELERKNQDLQEQLAKERSPSHIVEQAQKMGMKQADPNSVEVIVVPHLRPIPEPGK
ncbi:cell division protein FtsL [Thermosporothrix hazakensis]|uniref:Cell division protein FtsL n=2 Tax=Thermosporothrix TaxID=768650 RepID=A0A326U468_THEHA|nr:FtsL-like putative cell division protein [Thermosporothrix hazakensis]PZW23960.1 cell division protein FtsL [Thermosporothrix hazakensis]BBH90404.1 hypothetical protein KTC_51550 [Thermosporothrix sp. COM3]GCE48441.1 hypothetical protein KTH_33100 [Thermosporothrix hazakensis]